MNDGSKFNGQSMSIYRHAIDYSTHAIDSLSRQQDDKYSKAKGHPYYELID